MRKGLSPLVATVLLVSITIVVAAIVASFANVYVRGETEKIQQETEAAKACDFANLLVHEELKSFTASTGTINIGVTNIGRDDLSNFTFIVKKADGTFSNPVATTPVETLEPNEFVILSAAGQPQPEEVVIRTSCSNLVVSVPF